MATSPASSTAVAAAAPRRRPRLPKLPVRYEWALENERATVLRRRFLWFTGILGILSLAYLPIVVWDWYDAGPSASRRRAELIAAVRIAVQVAVLAWAYWYAIRQERNERSLYTMAFWLVVSLGVLALVSNRATVAVDIGDAVRAVEGDLPPPPGGTADVGRSETIVDGESYSAAIRLGGSMVIALRSPPSWIVSLVTLLGLWWSIFRTHMLACLFLPWTAREAWRPAMWLLTAALAIVAVDLTMGLSGLPFLGLGVVLLPLAAMPGVLWCVWRHSKLRASYKVRFVSDQFRQLEQDLAGARRVHDTVLPGQRDRGCVRVAYAYEPARQIGGDLIFTHPRQPLDDNLGGPVSVIVVDVAGHGIAAALAVARIAGELERLFAEHKDMRPDRAMTRLNRYVSLTLARHGAFATGFVVRIDPSAEKPLSYCGAGHPDAMLCRQDGKPERLESTSIMLGVLPHGTFEATSTELEFGPGDALLLYTDGASEARNGKGEMLGIDGVERYTADAHRDGGEPLRWPGAILGRVATRRNAPPEDDTLVAAIYRPAE